MQQQATVAYVQAQRIGKQAAPVVKTIATGVAIFQIVLALFLTVIDIGLVAAAYSEARFFSHIVSFFLSYPDPSAQGAGNSFAGFATTMLLFVEIVGIGVAVAGVLGASTVLLALIRAYHRRPA